MILFRFRVSSARLIVASAIGLKVLMWARSWMPISSGKCVYGTKEMNEIFHRVSIRKYQDKPVENEKIMQILRAGMQAPSAGNQQPWEFFVVTNKEKIRELSMSHQYAGCAAGAPVLIVPVYRKEGLCAPD